jgi:DNA-binding transcriptional LysR family regulator
LDLHALGLFQVVAEQRSFTRAAERARLTQSAVTRQIKALETTLGVALFERTTRSVKLTSGGEWLLGEARRLLGDVNTLRREMQERFTNARPIVQVGVSRSIGLAYLPGFFHANLRAAPEVGYRVRYESGAQIVAALEDHALDVGVICPPGRLPKTLRATHRFADAFTLIAPQTAAVTFPAKARQAQLQAWAERQNWLLLDEKSQTGARLRAWMILHGAKMEPALRLDGFDVIISLVALGLGVSFVPIRALASHGHKKNLRRLEWPQRFVRSLAVVVRAKRDQPAHVRRFVENVLF